MTTVVLGQPVELERWLEQRTRLGQDRYDEVWAGECHVVPGPSSEHAAVDASLADALAPAARERRLARLTAFNLGEPDDHRVPDGGCTVLVPVVSSCPRPLR